MHTAPPFKSQVTGTKSQVPSQNLLPKKSFHAYFEFIANFAHRKKAKGRRNQKIQTAFSNFRQISAPGPSGNKLILTISFPPLD